MSAVVSATVAAGAGNDTVNLQGISAANFPALKRTVIDVDGAEADVVNGTLLDDRVIADNLDTVLTGAGNDFVDGGQSVNGGDGDDVLYKVGGPADGGSGDDRIVNPGSGPFNGGAGIDTLELDFIDVNAGLAPELSLTVTDQSIALGISPNPPTVFPSVGMEVYEIELPEGVANESADTSAFSGRALLFGLGGHDVLTSGAGEDHLDGGAGPDTLTAGGGSDVVRGGGGDDTIDTRDGAPDRVDCGGGADSVKADRLDALVGCETIDVPPPVTGKISGPKKVAKGKKGVFTFTSDAPGATFECKVDKGAFKACGSPFKVKTKKLKTGKHTLQVRASEPAGNVDVTPEKKKFKVT